MWKQDIVKATQKWITKCLTGKTSCYSELTEFRDKVTGTPSLVFQILAAPSVDVEAKYSESKLKIHRSMGKH